MASVNPMSLMLLLAGTSTTLLALFYVLIAGAAKGSGYEAGRRVIEQTFAFPLVLLGVLDAVGGYFLAFNWPLPGAYNILFGDPLLVLGVIMVTAGLMMLRGLDYRVVTVIAFPLGVYLLVGAHEIISLGLTETPTLASALYACAGLASTLSPLTYLDPRSGSGRIACYLVAALLTVTSVILLFTGYTAYAEHIERITKSLPIY